jgi:transmembrane sensor
MNRYLKNMRAIAQVQDDWAESSDLSATVRERLFSDAHSVRPRRLSKKTAWYGAGGAALALAAGFALLWLPKNSTLTFSVGQEQVHGAIGKWVSASPAGVLPLTFSDGTQIVLQQSAQARVTELQARGAHVVLERGKLVASVLHQKDARWELQAGPFAVFVRGTRFNLGWSPETSTFALELTEGLVDVTGPGLTGARPVHHGQTLRVIGDNGSWHVETGIVGASNGSVEPATAASEVTNVAGEELVTVGAASASAPKGMAAYAPDWQDLAAAGSYVDSLTLARKQGLQKIYAGGSVAELTKLAQVARFAGDAESARGALRAVRERFAGSAEAAMATFDLGRLAFDTSGRYLEAAHWFKDYLREFPHGNLARESMGRLIEALERGGDHSGAREAASEYLLRFPSGPHAGLAHRVLAR